MNYKSFCRILFFLIVFSSCKGQPAHVKLPEKSFSVAFYNLENLFDTINDPLTYDEDFTPIGKYQWNGIRFNNKLNHMAEVVSQLGDKGSPDFVGLCEVENREVLNAFVDNTKLKERKYGIAHFESPDERGIDVAFIYNQSLLTEVNSQKITVNLGENDRTRDILYVTGLINHKDTIHFFVCHFPSRRGGQESEEKRIKASQTLTNFIITKHLVNTNVVILGDFNDNPTNKSMNNIYYSYKNEHSKDNPRMFSNVFWNEYKEHKGSLAFQGHWDLFDQIVVSNSLYQQPGGLDFVKKSELIFRKPFMLQEEVKHLGEPLRTFNGNSYINGYSDHLPVVTWFSYE